MSNSDLFLWIVPGVHRRVLIQHLVLAHELNVFQQARLYVGPGEQERYRSALGKAYDPDKMRLCSGVAVERGDIIRLGMDLSLHLARKGCDDVHVVVAPQRSAAAVVEWVQRVLNCDIRYYTQLDDMALSDLIGTSPQVVDRLAAKCLATLIPTAQGKMIPLSRWSDFMIRVAPQLADKNMRKALLGVRKFSDYARLIGLEVKNDHFSPAQTVHVRPSRQDLVDVFEGLCESDADHCLFLHWANVIQTRFPMLRESDVRKRMFGSSKLDVIAEQCGLIRKDQILQRSVQSPLIQYSPCRKPPASPRQAEMAD